MLFRYIAAIWLWKKGQVVDRAILVEIDVEPELYTFNIKTQFVRIIFHVHQHIRVSPECPVDVILINGSENGRVMLAEGHILIFVFSDHEDFRGCDGIRYGLRNGMVQEKGERYDN